MLKGLLLTELLTTQPLKGLRPLERQIRAGQPLLGLERPFALGFPSGNLGELGGLAPQSRQLPARGQIQLRLLALLGKPGVSLGRGLRPLLPGELGLLTSETLEGTAALKGEISPRLPLLGLERALRLEFLPR